MAEQDLARVLERAIFDADFRQQLRRDPERALAGYDLGAAEREALLSADDSQLRGLGVDARVTKASTWKIMQVLN